MIIRTRSLLIGTTFAALLATACTDSTSPIQLTGLRASGGTGISGGGGTGGGGGVPIPATGFAGKWSGTIGNSTSGTGLFTMQLFVVDTTVTGNLRAGAPIFDSGFNISSGSLTSPTTMVVLIARSHGFIVVSGTLSADGTTITGIFDSNGGPSYPYRVTRQ